ncbi:MAG TPA: LamG domain-containing protein, partial [Cytophagaceae bacterium]|nr:LamG domain-containing protein [Cytophagaceae bacterium]
MKRLLSAILFIHNLSFAQPGPDSGRNLVFSNTATNRVNIPDAVSFDHPDNNITIEAWVNPTTYTADGEMIFSKDESATTSEYYIYILPSGQLRFLLLDYSSAYYYTVSTTTIPLNTWTHVAATYSFSTGITHLYFN